MDFFAFTDLQTIPHQRESCFFSAFWRYIISSACATASVAFMTEGSNCAYPTDILPAFQTPTKIKTKKGRRHLRASLGAIIVRLLGAEMRILLHALRQLGR